jgi:UPF0176 protein
MTKDLTSYFVGKNFVFDNRLGERVTEDIISVCHQCGEPADSHVNCANDGCHLLFIQCEKCSAALNQCCSEECREEYSLPKEERVVRRKGRKLDQNIFNKSGAIPNCLITRMGKLLINKMQKTGYNEPVFVLLVG